MKKNRKPSSKALIVDRQLQAQGLALVRGGDNGVLHMQTVVGGGVSANENGVIHAQ
jgi:hypothetical protein